MLTRIYIDNYKCFQDFSLSFKSINLLIGPNGSGKSSIFQVLRKLNGFVALQMQARDLFFAYESTRWLNNQSQQFGIDFEHEDQHYEYHLEIVFDSNGIPSVSLEYLHVDKVQLVRFEGEKVYQGEQSPYPLESSRSAIASIPRSSGVKQLDIFRRLLNRILVVQVVPPIMEGTSSEETVYLWPDSRNWVSWYRHASQDQGLINELRRYLADIFPGFDHFRFVDIGMDQTGKSSKGLFINFTTNLDARMTGYAFAELSDGQRALIAMYTLLVYAKREECILCLDEPENFLALAEIQPWLIELYDLCSSGDVQAFLISHHPEMINYLASDAGIWFERSHNGSVVAKRIENNDKTGLPVSELVARGWLHG